MLYINPEKIVADFPAITYMEARPTRCFKRDIDVVHLHHNDVFAVDMGRGMKEFTAFTIAGYAVENAEDTVEAIENAKANGHELVTANGNGVSLTAWEQEKKKVGVLTLGQTVKIEGHLYTVKRASNDNISFHKI